jgi:hypothetical protein
MPRITPLQASFASGELSPRLHRRSDLQKYASGVARLENALIVEQTQLMRRPGSRHMAHAWGYPTTPATTVRLMPFPCSRRRPSTTPR